MRNPYLLKSVQKSMPQKLNKLSTSQIRLYKKLNKPWKVQDFLNTLEINFEEKGDTHYSPKLVLEKNKAQCIEGACLAASILRFHGAEPLLLDLRTVSPDVDHVVAIFTWKGYLGALSKTNHAVLRYRDPIYKTLRELALSYFHEYFLDNGKKTLREYSQAFNLKRYDKLNWETTEDHLWQIPEDLDNSSHVTFVDKDQARLLRKADNLERYSGKFTDWQLKKDKVKKSPYS